MKKSRKLLTMILLTTLLSATTNAADPILLKLNQPAPFEGFLFDRDQTIKMKNDLIDKDKLQLQVTSYTNTVDLMKFQLKLRKEQVDILIEQNKRLLDQTSFTTLDRYIWFGLGMLATSLAVYGGIKVVESGR